MIIISDSTSNCCEGFERRVNQLKRKNELQQREIEQLRREIDFIIERLRDLEDECCESSDEF